MNTSIGHLIRQRDSLLKMSAKLDALCTASQAEQKAGTALMAKAGLNGDITYVFNEARNHITDYADMMTKVIENTPVDWPPDPSAL